MNFRKTGCLMAWLFGLSMAGSVPALAQTYESVYTPLDLDNCTQMETQSEDEGDAGGAWMCQGLNGIPVYIADGDARMFASFGPRALEELASEQTLSGFNLLGETIEWRLLDGIPVAAILPWLVDAPDGGEPTRVLVAIQLLPGDVCQIARIDTLANDNAQTWIRNVASEAAGLYNCAQGPTILGVPGVSQ